MSEAGVEQGWGQIRLSEERAEQAKRLAQLIAGEPFHKRSWAELGFFVASSALACGGVFALGALGIAGLVTHGSVVGVVILAGDLRAARGIGRWQRALARRLLGEDISEPEPFTARPGVLGVVAVVPRRPGRMAGGRLLRRQGPAHHLRRVVRAQRLGRGPVRDRFAFDGRHRDGQVRGLQPSARAKVQPRSRHPVSPPTLVCS